VAGQGAHRHGSTTGRIRRRADGELLLPDHSRTGKLPADPREAETLLLLLMTLGLLPTPGKSA